MFRVCVGWWIHDLCVWVCLRRENWKGLKEKCVCVYAHTRRCVCTNHVHNSISVHAGMRGCVGESIRGQKRGGHKRQEEKEWKRDSGEKESSNYAPTMLQLCCSLFVSLHWLPLLGSHTAGMHTLQRSVCVCVIYIPVKCLDTLSFKWIGSHICMYIYTYIYDGIGLFCSISVVKSHLSLNAVIKYNF